MHTVLVDADSCPVKDEVYRVAERYQWQVTLVSNSWMRTPSEDWIELVIVRDQGQLDEADDWIAERAADGDVVVTEDIILASRCLPQGARVLNPRGKVFSEATIGEALATRELMADLREAGAVTGGPAPFEKRDRSHFLQRLDEAIQAVRRG